MADPLIISCALTGTLATIDDNPHLPYDPEAIGRAAVEAWREGAAIVHIHARADDGTPAWQPGYFQRAIDVIRSEDCDVVINLTTSYGGTGDDDWGRRFAALDVGPDLASFDCGTMNFGDMVFRNTPQFLAELAQRMLSAGVKPELEIFDSGQIGNALRLAGEGLLRAPLFFQFVLGVAGGAPATVRDLLHLVQAVPRRVAVVGVRARPRATADERPRDRDGRPRSDRARGQPVVPPGRPGDQRDARRARPAARRAHGAARGHSRRRAADAGAHPGPRARRLVRRRARAAAEARGSAGSRQPADARGSLELALPCPSIGWTTR